jgi:hypothetical protein
MSAHVTVPMHSDAVISYELPQWVKLAMSDAMILFGRLEHEIIEVTWLMKEADMAARVKSARKPISENFQFIIDEVKKQANGASLSGLEDGFDKLAKDRNLIAHGSWWIVDGENPWVVWHKFIEDDGSVIGEFFEKHRFDHFMYKAGVIYDMIRNFHNMLEEGLGKKTSTLRAVAP